MTSIGRTGEGLPEQQSNQLGLRMLPLHPTRTRPSMQAYSSHYTLPGLTSSQLGMPSSSLQLSQLDTWTISLPRLPLITSTLRLVRRTLLIRFGHSTDQTAPPATPSALSTFLPRPELPLL